MINREALEKLKKAKTDLKETHRYIGDSGASVRLGSIATGIEAIIDYLLAKEGCHTEEPTPQRQKTETNKEVMFSVP